MSEKKPTALAGDVIETARLRLRMFRPADLDDLAALLADPEVMKYVADGKPASREETRKALDSIIQHWRRHGFGRWAVEDKGTLEFVGFGGLRSLFGMPEVVYHFATQHWGKGLATEMGRASLRYGFETHHFARIVAIAKPENLASIHVMEKLGMRYEKDANYYGIHVAQYGTSREEFVPDDSVYVIETAEQT